MTRKYTAQFPAKRRSNSWTVFADEIGQRCFSILPVAGRNFLEIETMTKETFVYGTKTVTFEVVTTAVIINGDEALDAEIAAHEAENHQRVFPLATHSMGIRYFERRPNDASDVASIPDDMMRGEWLLLREGQIGRLVVGSGHSGTKIAFELNENGHWDATLHAVKNDDGTWYEGSYWEIWSEMPALGAVTIYQQI